MSNKERLYIILKEHDNRGDGTIPSELLTKVLQILDAEGRWTEAKLNTLYDSSGSLRIAGDEERVDVKAFVDGIFDGKGDVGRVVDYTALRAELRALMESPHWDDGSYAPLLIRLAWHSSGTYDATDGTGGSNGATMRHAIEAVDPENAGLVNARELLEPLQQKHPNISVADLWVLAALVAIEHTGGPQIPFTGGRVDAGPDRAIRPGRLPGAETGLMNDTMEVDESGRIVGWEAVAQHIRDTFRRMGFSDREAVALICGGHAYGRCHPEFSGYAGAWVENPTIFNNEYAADMIEDDWVLVGHDTKMPDGNPVPEEVRPAVGKRQYIDLTIYEACAAAQAARAAPDAVEFKPGRYQCTVTWVNVRALADTASSIIGRFVQDQLINVLTVKVFGTAIRGCIDCGGWVSIVGSGGSALFERVGDLDLKELSGRYRAALALGLPVLDKPDGTVPHETVALNSEFVVEELAHGKEAGELFGRLVTGAWVLLFSPLQPQQLAAERVLKAWNETPRQPIKGQTKHQMMLISDMVLLWDVAFREHLEAYAEDEDLLRSDFGSAFGRLVELGCPWSADRGPTDTGCLGEARSCTHKAEPAAGCPFRSIFEI